MTDDRLLVVPLGVGDAFTKKWYSTTLLLSAGGKLTLVDIPDPPRKVLHESGTAAGIECGFDKIDDVILTHVHGDHANGLECFGFYKRFFQKKVAQDLVDPEVFGPLWENKLKAAMGRIYTDPECTVGRDVGLEEYLRRGRCRSPGGRKSMGCGSRSAGAVTPCRSSGCGSNTAGGGSDTAPTRCICRR